LISNMESPQVQSNFLERFYHTLAGIELCAGKRLRKLLGNHVHEEEENMIQ